jgi:hypothetical protein
MSEATTTTPTTPTANQSGAPLDAGVTTSSESQSNLQKTTSPASTQTQPLETTKAQTVEVRNAQAASTFNPFLADGSGKEKFNFDSIIPETHKESDWVKNISKSEDPVSELFKKVDNLESLTQRPRVPDENATPEQRKAFYKSIGVPEDVKGYEVKSVEWAPEDKPFADSLKQYKPEPFMNELKKAAMESGVSKAAWEKLEQTWDKATVQQLKTTQAAGKQLDVDFDQTMTKMYGDQKMAVMDRGSKLLSQFAPVELKGVLAKAPNDLLAAFAGTLSNIYKATTAQDTFNTGTGNTTTSGSSGSVSRQELNSMLNKRESMKKANNTMSPEFEALNKKINAAYQSLPDEVLKQPLSLM